MARPLNQGRPTAQFFLLLYPSVRLVGFRSLLSRPCSLLRTSATLVKPHLHLDKAFHAHRTGQTPFFSRNTTPRNDGRRAALQPAVPSHTPAARSTRIQYQLVAMSVIAFTSWFCASLACRSRVLLLLLAAAVFVTMPAAGQNGPSSGAGPVLSEQASVIPRPGESLQRRPVQAGPVQAGLGQLEAGLQARSLGVVGPRLGPSERDSVLRPVSPSGRSLRARLRKTVRQSTLDARVHQGQNGLGAELTSKPPHRRRWDAFRSEVVSVRFVAGSVLGGTIEHLAGSPGALDRDTRGYLARVGTNAASRLTYVGLRHGVSAAFGLRLKSPEPQGPLGARLRQAALQALTTRTVSGQRVPAVAETAGTYGTLLTRWRLYHGQWRPGQAATSTAVAIGFKVIWATGIELVGAL